MNAAPQARIERKRVDLAGERVGALVATLGYRLHVFVAWAREEAEDILDAAQNLRHGGQA